MVGALPRRCHSNSKHAKSNPPLAGALPSRRHCHRARSTRTGSRQAKRRHSTLHRGLGKNSPCLKKTSRRDSRDLSDSSRGSPEDRVTEVRGNLTFPRTSRGRLVRHEDPDRVGPRSRRSTCHCILQDHTKVWALPPRLVLQIKEPIMAGALLPQDGLGASSQHSLATRSSRPERRP